MERLNLSRKDRILVAYSGGGDSTFLLLEALKFFEKGNVIAAYVNYHDSEHTPEEERIVTDCCNTHEVRLERKDVSLHWTTTDFEAKARDIRYEYFRELIQKLDLKGVLVAHHANDDAETYLFQRNRGSIVKNLGLSPTSTIYGIDVYRPLLPLKKSEIIDSLNERRIEFFEDPTNKNWDRFRDRMRMTILSTDSEVDKIIEERNVQAVSNNNEIEETNKYLSNQIHTLSEYRKLSENTQRRILFSLSQRIFDDNDKVVSSTNLCHEFLKSNNTGVIELSEDVCLYKDKLEFFLGRPIKIKDDYSFKIDKPGTYELGGIHLDIEDPSLFKISNFPVFIKPVRKGDLISTKLEGKDAWNTMRKHDVPSYLRNIYPAIYKEDGTIAYLPFYPNKYLYLEIERIG